MNTREFCKELVGQITHDEWDALDRCDPSLTINNHNREALLEMRALYMAPGTAEAAKEPTHPELDVDLEAAENLALSLQEYLDEYMSDNPEGHK